jgi:hypothetical protein
VAQTSEVARRLVATGRDDRLDRDAGAGRIDVGIGAAGDGAAQRSCIGRRQRRADRLPLQTARRQPVGP